jgi:subtilisin family serine protease
VTSSELQALQRNGIEVGEYLGGTSYTARVRQLDVDELVRASKDTNTVQHAVALDERNARIKIDPALAHALQAKSEGAATAEPSRNIVVHLWPEVDAASAKGQLEAYGTVRRVDPATRKIEMSLRDDQGVGAISTLKDVKYITPSYELKAQNTHIRHNLGIQIATAEPHQLSGRGVRVGVYDGGHVAADHPSFTGRLFVDLALEGLPARKDNAHSTHVAGTIAGSGEYTLPAVSGDGASTPRESEFPGFGKVREPNTAAATSGASAEAASPAEASYPGIAPNAQILSVEFNGAADKLIRLLARDPNALDLMNNSWNIDFKASTCGQMGIYGPLGGRDFDAVISGEVHGQPIRRIPIVFSAGNNRNDGICGLSTAPGFPNYRTVLPPSTAKNVITVGAIDADTNEMTDFSAWGPTNNGRIKPDVVAPGCRSFGDGGSGIISMIPASGIGRNCGTSMAAPAVTGLMALMIEKMEKLGLQKSAILPSTYKVLLIHAAADLGRPGPDFEFGYGRVQAAPTLELMDDQAFRQLRIDREGEVQAQEIAVEPGLDELKVTLVWDDRPVGIFSDEALSNDLDLVLVSPLGKAHLPFLLNPVAGKETEAAHPGVDHINVVEQVVVKQPSPGVWRITVQASKIGSPTGGQTYSLVMSAK